ncbi:MAG: GGDEF domain-containing phosphodiesterase [Gammaproteobacteria bacterium]
MARSESPSSSEESPRPEAAGKPAPGLMETLRRAVTELEAAAVGVTRATGGPPKFFTRTALAAQFFEDICSSGLDSLAAQTQAKLGVFGTNRVRADNGGPVRGRLIAVSLRSPHGLPLGILIAVRLIEDPKFGPVESQRLLALAGEFVNLLSPKRAPVVQAPPPPRGMWPAQIPNKVIAAPAPVPASAAPPPPAVTAAPPAIDELLEDVLSVAALSHTADREISVNLEQTADDVVALVTVNVLASDGDKPFAVSAVPTIEPAAEVEPAPATEPPAPVVIAAMNSGSPADPIDPRATIASLLDWSAFEKLIRAQEALDRLPGCVIYGDMDQLHVLNKLAGFAAGDRAISDVGAALQTSDLPLDACSCHLSGDRFTVYVPRTTLAQARRVAEQLSQTVSGLSAMVHKIPTPLSISFGVALIPSTEGGLGHALAAAEAACKTAKDRGRGRVEVYQDADQSIVRCNDDVLVADKLRQALDAGRVEVFAQPIVRLDGSPSTANYELLVRLMGDAGTHLSPAWFMSAATRYRMLVELDRAVVAHVLGKLEANRTELAKKNLRFSVNLSGPTIGDPDFLEWISARIGGNGVPGEWLQFEITETAAVANVAQTQAMIRRLRARGVQFALDDFGTGVSSFAYLKFFDVKMLKLDGTFVRDLLGNPRSESLVRGIAQLGRGMGIETVAECVETAEVRDRITELGIDCAQGFLFGRPAPFDGILTDELGPGAVLSPAAAP